MKHHDLPPQLRETKQPEPPPLFEQLPAEPPEAAGELPLPEPPPREPEPFLRRS
jgi:hypothetical protein